MDGAPDTDGCRSASAAEQTIDGIVAQVRWLSRGIDHYRQAVHAGTGLTGSELTALGAVADRGPLRAVDVCTATGLTAGSVTALLDRLAARDLVRRHRPADNKRVVAVVATPEGHALLATVVDPLRDLVAALTEPARPDALDADAVLRTLMLLASGVEELDGPGPVDPVP